MVEAHKAFGETFTHARGWAYWTSLQVDNPDIYRAVEAVCAYGETTSLGLNVTGRSTKIWPSVPKYTDIGFDQIAEVSHRCDLPGLLPKKRYYYIVGDNVSGVFSPIASFVTQPNLCQGAAPPSWPDQPTANWCPQIDPLSTDETLDPPFNPEHTAESPSSTWARSHLGLTGKDVLRLPDDEWKKTKRLPGDTFSGDTFSGLSVDTGDFQWTMSGRPEGAGEAQTPNWRPNKPEWLPDSYRRRGGVYM